MTFYRDKLLEAVRALVDDRALALRLTYAAGCLLQLDDDDVPAGGLAEFERVRDPLIGKPIVARGEMLPRALGAAEARAAAQAIVSLLAAEMERSRPTIDAP